MLQPRRIPLSGERRVTFLALTNLYPPVAMGGYELGCRDVVEGLRGLGHRVVVLTSCHGRERIGQAAEELHRSLPHFLEPERPLGRWWHALSRERRSRRIFARTLARIQPQLLYVWNLGGLSKTLPFLVQDRPVLFAVSDYSLMHLYDPYQDLLHAVRRASDSRARSLLKAMLRGTLLREAPLKRPAPLHHCYFTSRYLKERYLEEGWKVEAAPVIHWGIPLELFRPASRSGSDDRQLRLLYVGRISREKGVHVAVEAFCRVHQRRRSTTQSLRLDLWGPVQDPDYGRRLEELVARAACGDRVHFRGQVDRTALAKVYTSADILLFPSIWEEPFALTPLEAMACGLCVVGTPSGGSSELLQDHANALVVPPDDPEAMARAIEVLQADPPLRRRLADAGSTLVRQHYGRQVMLRKVCDFLDEILHQGTGGDDG